VDALRKTPDKVNAGGHAAASFHQFVFCRFQQVAHFKTEGVPFQGARRRAIASSPTPRRSRSRDSTWSSRSGAA
jgi:tripartite-type tricarboxylate transporter receptor subunit TctC